ncbi:BnaC02g34850D [Brassica napus]|uniref:(rape) hypothetical protein n=1 Tax=Brassica napus TaxID=3708 RepID=A0A078HH27_BRANA|nr:unnamed protein product [Brassica napus]CDY37177.1 BnaC02g34850D [Brassica napus]
MSQIHKIMHLEAICLPPANVYGQKADDLYSDKFFGYVHVDTRQFGERSNCYCNILVDVRPPERYCFDDMVGYALQTDLYDQASLLRGEQLFIQSLHTSAVDGHVSRRADYLTELSSALRHSDQEGMHYGRRLGFDTHGLSVQNTSSYATQHIPSYDYIYPESSLNPGYGVSLPPGMDYGTTGKGILSASSLDFRREKESLVLAHGGGGPRVDDLRKDGRVSYLREFELREVECRRENLHAGYKEREQERERERQRTKDKKRILTARPTYRDPKEQTPVRKTVSRDARGSSLRRVSQHHEASIRRHSPIRPIRSDYVCKVLPSRLVDMERDYLALDKRYPRLFVPSEFSKVVVNWPKQKLSLSMNTVVSFEHDYTEDGGVDVKYMPTKSLAVQTGGKTVWNAKMILMSGLSRTAWEDLGSDKLFEDRVPHICNILKFGVLEKDRSFMATGGPWDPTDGIDPSVDQSSLIKTMLRHTKDKLHLDLSNCRHWNPFLEIHYDRVGTDGVSSFREITILFVPDLSECLPSFDAWKPQWLAHKKVLAERDRLLSQEIKKDVIVGKGSNDAGEVAKDAEKKTSGDPSNAQATRTKKTVKKFTKGVVKRPVNDEKGVARPGENEEKGSEIIVGAQTGGSSDPGAKANEQTPSKTRIVKKKVAEVDKSMDSVTRRKWAPHPLRIPLRAPIVDALIVFCSFDSFKVLLRSLSVSLDSLLDYTDKDIDESSFEVSFPINTALVFLCASLSLCSTGIKTKHKHPNTRICSMDGLVLFISSTCPFHGLSSYNDHKSTPSCPQLCKSFCLLLHQLGLQAPNISFLLQRDQLSLAPCESQSIPHLEKVAPYSLGCSSCLYSCSLFSSCQQYQMGTRSLEFLKKLRVKFVRQGNQRKRHQEELSAKQKEAETQNKRQKTVEHNDKETPAITESVPEKDDKESSAKETVANTGDPVGKEKTTGDEAAATMENGEDDEIDEGGPEEDPEEDPEELDANPEQEETVEVPRKKEENKKKRKVPNLLRPNPNLSQTRTRSKRKERLVQQKEKKRLTKSCCRLSDFLTVTRQANVRVEDMRITIHSLGKFISHREVKELVQSALLESNTGRDDRILYNKLVRELETI